MTPPPYTDSGALGWAVPGVTGLAGAVPAALPPVSERIAVVQQLLAEEARVSAVELPGAQALADTAGLLAARDQLDRLLLARVGDVEVRQLARTVGAVTTGSWLREQDGEAPASVVTSRRLVQHRWLGEAVADGRLGTRAADRVGRALALLRPHLDRPDGLIDAQDGEPVLAALIGDGILDLLAEAFGGPAEGTPSAAVLDEAAHALSQIAGATASDQLERVERALVLLAEHLPARFLPSALARVTGALLPTRLEDAAERGERDRRLTLTPLPDGGGLVSGHLTAEAYELLHAVLDAAALTDPASPGDTSGYSTARQGGWQGGDPLPDGTPVRSRAQRLHDALVLGLRAVLDAGALGVRGKQAPHVDVTVSLAALHGAPGALPAVGRSGQVLPLSLVTGWMQDSWITRYVLDLRHRVVEVSHRERTLTAPERRIKDVETGRACQSVTCRHGTHPPPGTRLVPHHPNAWARTGTTSVHDTVMLCEQEHYWLHHGATLLLRDGRRLTADGYLDPDQPLPEPPF